MKRAEELAEFPRMFIRSEFVGKNCYKPSLDGWIGYNKTEEREEFLSLKEHQAILAAAEKDALNSEVVVQMAQVLNHVVDDFFSTEISVRRAKEALAKLNKARSGND